MSNNIKANLLNFLKKHNALYSTIYAFHMDCTSKGVVSRGHSIDHDLAVAAHALLIGDSLEDSHLGNMSAVAALMHSYDRFGQDKSIVHIWAQDLYLLEMYTLSEIEEEIIAAVLRHDVPNKDKQVKEFGVVDVLADSDKLACLMLYNPVRSGQFDHSIPTLDLDHLYHMTPGANYKKHNTAWDDIYGMLEWHDDVKRWFKTPYAQAFAEGYGILMLHWLKTSIQQFHNLGLNSLPKPQD